MCNCSIAALCAALRPLQSETSVRLGAAGLMRLNQMWMREKNTNGNRRAEVVKCVGRAACRVINKPVVSAQYVLTDTF